MIGLSVKFLYYKQNFFYIYFLLRDRTLSIKRGGWGGGGRGQGGGGVFLWGSWNILSIH